ncbi:hypothetical protein M153_12700017735 [Pseudoloma neurophilia]|uniref:Uncharacterized protein n=1 Tax=Pseudoloma neurophilia TaxID=146866 RepID=A0A0R0M029_9MICR|nr:hypothetical protein M153_12700017735 [Pseudoloma neurophilia]
MCIFETDMIKYLILQSSKRYSTTDKFIQLILKPQSCSDDLIFKFSKQLDRQILQNVFIG